MSNDLNRVTLIGRLTRDTEIKYLQTGTAVCNFSVANNKSYTTNGEKKEEVGYFDCTVWGKLAEVAAKYLQKGSKLAIEGRLQQRRWEDTEGKKHTKVDIVVENFQFLDNKRQEDAAPEGLMDGATTVKDDDIPF